jgi:hypothetical protein
VVNSYVPEELAAAICMVFTIQGETLQSKEKILITVQVNQSSRTIIYWYHILSVEITGNLQQSEKYPSTHLSNSDGNNQFLKHDDFCMEYQATDKTQKQSYII